MPFNSKFVFILNLSVLSHPSNNFVIIRRTGALYFHCCNLEFVPAVLFYSFTTTAGLLFLQLITSTYWLLVVLTYLAMGGGNVVDDEQALLISACYDVSNVHETGKARLEIIYLVGMLSSLASV